MLENRKYVIVNVSDVTDEMLSNSLEKKILRKSIDGSKTVLKWEGNTPSCFDGITTYTHSEIFAELSTDELIGGYDEKKGVRYKIDGYLEEFALTKNEADDLIINARNKVFK